MNELIQLICAHRSIRKFTPEPLTQAQVDAILAAAQAASTSSYLQATSIIRVTDQDKRRTLAACAGNQTWVEEAPEFWVWCADFYRHLQVAPQAKLGFAEQLLIGSIDTALMGQNALLAAEAMGLGGVFIGGLRNDPDGVVEVLELPRHVLPLFGLCLGYPAQDPSPRPRLPTALVVHENRYTNALNSEALEEYDAQVRAYYASRAGSDGREMSWSEQIAATLAKESRPHIRAFLQRQGFDQR